MTGEELRRTVRAHKGTIMAAIFGRDDVHFVKIVKSDLLEMLAHIADNELEARTTPDGVLYIDKGGKVSDV